MMSSVRARVVLLCGLLAGVAPSCAAQAYTPPPPPLTTLPPCPPDKDAKKRAKRKDCDPTVYPSETKDKKAKQPADAAPAAAPGGTVTSGAAADKFPYPGEQPPASIPAVKRFPYPGESSADVPHDPAADVKASDTPAGKTFPYPGENTPAAPPKDAPDDVKTTDTPSGRNYSFPGDDSRNVPHDPAAEKKAAESSAGKAFPYPGENSERNSAETSPAASAPRPDDSSASSSSSGSSSSSSDDPGAGAAGDSPKSSRAKNPDDDDDDGPPKLADKGSTGRRTLKVVKPQSDDDRVDEDLSVAKFYGQSGNYMGAYLRAKDAVKTEPDYAEGHFALGEAAKQLKKKDEAVAEFRTYLKLSPDGEKAKAAEKELGDLK